LKSLQEVVHLYNKGNIAMNAKRQKVVFDLRNGPTAGCTPIWPATEVLDKIQKVIGHTPTQTAAKGTTGVTSEKGQVGNLGLTASEEADLVIFLMILTDGHTKTIAVGN
jgi:hypothetical protein